MPIFGWRADDREPDIIRMKNRFNHPGGFNAWVPLTPAQARGLIEFCWGDYNGVVGHTLDWPMTTTQPSKAAIEKGKPDIAGLGDEIRKWGKSHSTVHVSTGVDNTCGGYSGTFDYNYKFILPPGLQIATSGGNCTALTNNMVWGTGAHVLCNNSVWGQASTIIIRQKLEYTFLTGIPLKWITHWKGKNQTWKRMNTTELQYKAPAMW